MMKKTVVFVVASVCVFMNSCMMMVGWAAQQQAQKLEHQIEDWQEQLKVDPNSPEAEKQNEKINNTIDSLKARYEAIKAQRIQRAKGAQAVTTGAAPATTKTVPATTTLKPR